MDHGVGDVPGGEGRPPIELPRDHDARPDRRARFHRDGVALGTELGAVFPEGHRVRVVFHHGRHPEALREGLLHGKSRPARHPRRQPHRAPRLHWAGQRQPHSRRFPLGALVAQERGEGTEDVVRAIGHRQGRGRGVQQPSRPVGHPETGMVATQFRHQEVTGRTVEAESPAGASASGCDQPILDDDSRFDELSDPGRGGRWGDPQQARDVRTRRGGPVGQQLRDARVWVRHAVTLADVELRQKAFSLLRCRVSGRSGSCWATASGASAVRFSVLISWAARSVKRVVWLGGRVQSLSRIGRLLASSDRSVLCSLPPRRHSI